MELSATRSLAGVLAGVPRLHRLRMQQRARLARLITVRHYRPGTTVVHQGDTGMTFYIVLAGLVRLEREQASGQPCPIAEIGPGGTFGESGLIEDAPRPATAIAVEPTECALITYHDLRRALRPTSWVPFLVPPARELVGGHGGD